MSRKRPPKYYEGPIFPMRAESGNTSSEANSEQGGSTPPMSTIPPPAPDYRALCEELARTLEPFVIANHHRWASGPPEVRHGHIEPQYPDCKSCAPVRALIARARDAAKGDSR